MTKVNLHLAQTLLNASKFPHKHLPLTPVQKQGHDHRTFRCGDAFSMRIPSASRYAAQIDKEARWLSYLSSKLTLACPTPVYHEAASALFNRPWIMHTWLEGETVTRHSIHDMKTFMDDLVSFIQDLHSIDTVDGPPAGVHNFYRGAHPSYYHEEVLHALRQLQDDIYHDAYALIWDDALKSTALVQPVWIHGDLELSNLLFNEGRLSAVIDFGNMAVGDPACDYVMAYTLMTKVERAYFFKQLSLDTETINKAKAWALWKALITVTNPKQTKSAHNFAQQTLDALLDLR